MKRVAIIGSGGAGKSTLAKEVGKKLSLPVIHLDQHFWNAGWTETPTSEWEARHEALLARERWVMDGNYSSTMNERIGAADTVIFLDLPRFFCVYRVLKRWLIRIPLHSLSPRKSLGDSPYTPSVCSFLLASARIDSLT